MLQFVAMNIFGWPDHKNALKLNAATAAETPQPPPGVYTVSGLTNKGDERVVMDVKVVDNASRSCGGLMRWMLELMKEHAEREGIRRELADLEPLLKDAQKRMKQLNAENNAAEEELHRLRDLIGSRDHGDKGSVWTSGCYGWGARFCSLYQF